MRMQVFKNIIVYITVLHLPTAGDAKILTANPNDTIEATDSVRSLDEMVVTAACVGKSLTSATPYFKIDDTQMLRRGVTDISDAIHRLPGVTLRDYGGAGGLKTVSVRGLGAAHTAVVYDGMPVSDIQSGAIDLSRYTIDNISALELVIGDNNDIFLPVKAAASAASLTLSALENDMTRPTALTVKMKAGSFGYVSPSLNFSQRIGRQSTIGVSADYLHTDNNYPFRLINGNTYTKERRENNQVNSGHAEINTEIATGKNGNVNAKVYYYDSSRELPGPVLYYNVSNNHEELKDRNAFAQAEYAHRFGNRWKLRAGGKFNFASTRYTDFASRRDEEYITEKYWQREYYATLNLLYQPTQQWSLAYSADYDYHNLNSNLTTDARPRRNAILQAVSAKLSSERLTMVARLIGSIYHEGMKDHVTYASDRKKLSPSLSISGKLLRERLLYARIAYKNIFRMPTFNEAYFHHFGSADLQPESTDQIDAGLSYQAPATTILPYLAVTADVYFNRVKDRIVAVPYNMFLWTITNLNSVHTTGADITLNTTLDCGRRQQLLMSGTWSYQRARISVDRTDPVYGKQVAYTPLNTGSFSISYENPWVNTVIHGQGTSAKYTQNSNIAITRMPGYFEFGMTLWRRFNIKQTALEVRLDMLNILDKQYSVIARYPMPGRSFMASVKVSLR